jgi:tetratricopeptide (TPR) repeat protein
MNNAGRLTLLCIACLILLSGCFGGNAKKLGNEVQDRAEAKHYLAVIAEQKGDIKYAEKFFQESLRLSASIGDNKGKAIALINLARLYRLRFQDKTKTREAINSALELLTPESDLYPEAAQEKALSELDSSNIPSALQWGEKAAATEKGALLGIRLNLLGRVQMAGGDKSAAEITLQKALIENRRVEHSEEEANSMRMLAIIARGGKRLQESDQMLSAALEIDKRLGASSKIAIDMEELAATSLASGATDKALTWLELAYEVNHNGGRQRKAVANLNALADVLENIGQAEEAGKARKKAGDIEKNLK